MVYYGGFSFAGLNFLLRSAEIQAIPVGRTQPRTEVEPVLLLADVSGHYVVKVDP